MKEESVFNGKRASFYDDWQGDIAGRLDDSGHLDVKYRYDA